MNFCNYKIKIKTPKNQIRNYKYTLIKMLIQKVLTMEIIQICRTLPRSSIQKQILQRKIKVMNKIINNKSKMGNRMIVVPY